MLLINLDNATAVRVPSPFASASAQRRYVLTSGAAADPHASVNDLLVSRRMRVNGILLQSDGSSVPDPTRLSANASGAALIELPPLSYAFVVFDGVAAPACTRVVV